MAKINPMDREIGKYMKDEGDSTFYKALKNYIAPIGGGLSLLALVSGADLGNPHQKAMDLFSVNEAEAAELTVCVESKDLDEGLLGKLESVLNQNGISTTEYCENADKIIRVSVHYKQPDCDIPSEAVCVDSATVTVKYINSDGTSKSWTYPKINANELDGYIDTYGKEMSDSLRISVRKEANKRSENKNEASDSSVTIGKSNIHEDELPEFMRSFIRK